MSSASVVPRSRCATRWALVIVLAGALAGCEGTNILGARTPASNFPVVGMSDGEFGFAIVASNWTYDQSFAPALSADTLQIGMVVAGYTTGTGTLAITDASGTSVFSQNLAGNIAEGASTTVHGTAPFHVRVTSSRYSGTISVGISPAPAPAATSPLGGERLQR